MNRKFTRLVCISIASFCVLSTMGQENKPVIRSVERMIVSAEDVRLRANDKQQPDSVVNYDDSGYAGNIFYSPCEGPTVYYNDYYKSWCMYTDHFLITLLTSGSEADVKYNSKGLVESISYSTDTHHYLRKFQYNANGHLLFSEYYYHLSGNTKWELTHKDTHIYDAYSNWIGYQSYTVDGNLMKMYTARVDGKGRIVYSEYRMGEGYILEVNGRESKFGYYIWYYSDGHTPNAEIENNVPVNDNNQGGFDLTVNIPVDSVENGSLVVQLPDGFTLDEANTSLMVEFAGLFDLTITKQENNSWLIEINPKSLKSAALRADEIGKMLHIAYKVNDSVTKGTYNISVNSIQFKTPGNNIIPEPAITVPVNVNRWGVGNENIKDWEPIVYITNHTLYIQAPQAEQIAIYTINGSKLYEATIPSGTATIDASAFPQGVLIVKGSSGWVKKVVR